MRMRLRLAVLCFLASGALSAQQPAPAEPQQAPPVTFRAEINYVEVDAVVTDANGNLVSNLTAADFQVLEDGRAQKIATFALVNIPVTRAEQPLFATAPIERDVQSNRDIDGRVYLLVLDSYHTSPLNALRVKVAARQFIERRLGANDLAAVVHTGGRSDVGQDFTNNRRLLMASVDRFAGEKLSSSLLAKLDQYNRTGPNSLSNPVNSTSLAVRDPDELERRANARAFLGSLKKLTEFLGGVRGRRKALVLFSEGLEYDTSNPMVPGVGGLIAEDVRDAIAAATRSNVSIYAVDPRGLSAVPGDTVEIESFPTDKSLGITLGTMLDEVRLSQENLRTLAEETGGFAAVNMNDFQTAFERVVRDNSNYYILGYYAENDRRDGRFRRIDVRVRRPGLQVRARRGYVAARNRPPEPRTPVREAFAPALREAMASPLPMAGIPMTVFAAPFKGVAANASVVLSVEMDARDFKYEERNGLFTDTLEVAVTPVDAKGVPKPGAHSKASLTLRPDTLERAKAYGVRVVSVIDLAPGRYQLRVAAAETGAERSGSVLYDLEIPDFTNGPLTMSGVTLTSAASAQVVTIGSEGAVAPMLKGPTTAIREFSRTDTLALFAEIYENGPGAPAHALDLTSTVRSEDGRVLFQNREERSSTELTGGRGGYGYATEIPLKDLAPGLYVIHVEGRSRATNAAGVGIGVGTGVGIGAGIGAGRDIQIRVR